MPSQRFSQQTPSAPAPGESFYQAYVRVELRRLAEFFSLLEKQRHEAEMDEDEAKLWASIAVNHAQSALSSLEVYGLHGAPPVHAHRDGPALRDPQQ